MSRSDRPLRRKLVKLAFSLAGSAQAHRQEVWPGLALTRASDGCGQVVYRGRHVAELLPAAALLEAMRDADPVIVGSGPSIAGQDRRVLADGRSILLNGAVSLIPEIGAPLAVAVEDERFVWARFALLRPVAREVPLILSPAVLRAIAEVDRDWLQGRQIVLAENILKPFDAARRRHDAPELAGALRCDAEAALSVDPAAGVVVCGTVAFTALQFALASGAPRIGLAGIDLGNAGQPRFYETAGTAVWSGISAGLGRILAHFALALSVAEERQCSLLCHSPTSALVALGYPTIDI